MYVRNRLAWLAALVALLAFVSARPSSAHNAATVPSGFSDTEFASGFAGRLTSMTFGPDGRLYVSEKQGSVRIVDHGRLLPTPFLTVSAATDSEKGLKGIAFDPDYATNGFVYVYYTAASTQLNCVTRFTRVVGDPNRADPSSEKALVGGINAGIYHSGGSLHFGADNKLYVSTGDASYGPSAQNLGNLDGKILRINTDGSVPSDNPFVGQTGRKPQIWAYGLRNPFTFAFSATGRLFINDVGEATWEEIDVGARGANYGWPTCEGVCGDARFVDPLYAYNHDSGPGKSITGGTFYEAAAFPAAYRGDFFFGDYVGNYIKSYDPTTRQVTNFATDALNPVDLDVGPDGALYYLSVETKEVHRIAYNGGGTPTPTPTPTPTATPQPGSNLIANGDFENTGTGWLAPWKTVVRSPATAAFSQSTKAESGASSFRAEIGSPSQDWYAQLLQPNVPLVAGQGYSLTFAASASSARTVRIAFQQNSGSYPLYFEQKIPITTDWHTYTATFTAKTSDPKSLFAINFGDAAGQLWIDDVELTPDSNAGRPPVPVIGGPAIGTTFRAGQVIYYSGSATDPEDGTLPASALTWEVVFHHDTHTHPFIEPFSGKSSGTFTIPTIGEVSPHIWYRIHLTATDSDGNKTEVTRDITPLTANVTMATSPSGLGLTVNGIPVTAPYLFQGVVGFQRELGAPATQTVGGVSYRFVSWSDGGASTHKISTPSTDTTYTAVYQAMTTNPSNLITNGGFDQSGTAWKDPWLMHARNAANATFIRDTNSFVSGPASMKVVIDRKVSDWYVQLNQANVALTDGRALELTFSARANLARNIRVAFQQNSGAYPVYFEQRFAIGTQWRTYTVRFTPGSSDPNTLFVINLGGPISKVWIDDVRLTQVAAQVRR